MKIEDKLKQIFDRSLTSLIILINDNDDNRTIDRLLNLDSWGCLELFGMTNTTPDNIGKMINIILCSEIDDVCVQLRTSDNDFLGAPLYEFTITYNKSGGLSVEDVSSLIDIQTQRYTATSKVEPNDRRIDTLTEGFHSVVKSLMKL